MSSETFDVFFSYNSKDRDAVRRVADEMRRQGLWVWMDEVDLPLGQPRQPYVETALQKVRSAAILLGPSGFGDWQREEARLCLTVGVKRHIPVIPVLLLGGPAPEALPDFLRERTYSDLRNDSSGDRLQRLIREIRGTVSRGPKIHNLPFLPLGDLLKGRDDELRTLEANLHGSTVATAITQTQAILGLGGIGKTRLAVEYAWRSGDRYDIALFVVADSPEALNSGLAGLARLSLPGLLTVPSRIQEEEVAAILAWLREHDRWLLILDNVDTEDTAEAVRKILPLLQGGHVLITSRRRNWPAGVRKQALDELSLDDAIALLLQRTEGERTPSKDDFERARQLAEILDGLPLALEQAAAYITHHQMTFSAYLGIWQNERESLLSWFDSDAMHYPASVGVTWQTTFRQLSSTAASILRLAAYLAPDPIPLDMFEQGAGIVEEGVESLREEVRQEVELRPVREAIAELAAYSMVTREDRTFTVHRMVQEVLRGRIPQEHRRQWIERSLRLVNDFSPLDPEDVRTWSVWDVLRPHVGAVVRYADEEEIARPTSRLMNQLEQYLEAKGLYVEAEPLIRRSLAIEEQIAPDSAETAIYLNNLASLLQATNRLAEAEPLIRRALKINEEFSGPDHPDVTRSLNNLASLLRDTNRLAEAEPLMRRALKIDEKSFGPDHPNVARDLDNLALLLWDTNRLAEAELLMRRALKIDEESFGLLHPNVARGLNNLALLFQHTNRFAEAEPLMIRALQIYEESLGPDHPNVARSLNNLALLLQGTNRLAEAEPLMRQAVEIYEASLGPGHPRAASTRSNLAVLLQSMTRTVEASEGSKDWVQSNIVQAESLDTRELLLFAFRLVVARRTSPDLLLHLDAARLREAAESVLPEGEKKQQTLQSRLSAVAELLANDLPEAHPDPLWENWMLATQRKTLQDLGDVLTSTPSTALPS